MTPIMLIGTIESEPVLTQSERFLHFHVAAERVQRDGAWGYAPQTFVCTAFGVDFAAPLSQQLKQGQRVTVTGHLRPRLGGAECVAVASVGIVGGSAEQVH